ncbi:hypothetical protein L1987_42742 [Smallanthus sonchifolius]|uniref:Uncharacterized protein n=1 Tax=Smallanthus sonchifolius TaxID=185202 RepID=A0ACB9GKX7_9ASTR|nr:hypothetical protein L1987_42742 [Smallanthus sonchifolius]
MIDLLQSSSIHFALTVDPNVYLATLLEFWANATIQTEQDKTMSITFTIKSKPTVLTPAKRTTRLQLDDTNGALTTDKTAIHVAFLELGYGGSFTKDTHLKVNFTPPFSSSGLVIREAIVLDESSIEAHSIEQKSPLRPVCSLIPKTAKHLS